MGDEAFALYDNYQYSTEDWWDDMDKHEREEYGNDYHNFRKRMSGVITDDYPRRKLSRKTSHKSTGSCYWFTPGRKISKAQQMKNKEAYEKAEAIYNINSEAKKGEECICPICGKHFIKEHYQQKFCEIDCKNKYWTLKRGKR